MKRRKFVKPTDSELEILQVLWKDRPSTVRFVNEKLNEKRKVGYTTTLKIMQIMTDKELVVREEYGRTHIYSALVKEDEAQSALLDKMVNTAFGGSAMKLVMQALGNHKPSRDELQQIRDLIDNLEKEGQ